MNKYPIYIISKGRASRPLTARALVRLGVPFRIVVEPQEHAAYAAVIDPAKILTLPFSNLGQGSIPARNWVWEHSISEGHARHWILDDNLREFFRFHQNAKVPVRGSEFFQVIEDFADRYENIPMIGPNYTSFVWERTRRPAFILNTRIYSCILISNAPSDRLMWRGRYNEDTDLSLRYLKRGSCTVLFNALLVQKMATLTMKGGNTDELYQQTAEFDGRLEMAKSLQRQHPDVTKITRKWGRWQHHVDYRPFKGNRLKLKPGVVVPEGVDNYGMKLVQLQPAKG